MAMNLSSLRSATGNMSSVAALMLSMPTRLYHHIRRVDDLLAADIQEAAQNTRHASSQQPPQFLSNLPGPWAFLTSGYAITLLIMAILLNRIQHIVVPPRHSLVQRLTRHYAQRTRPSVFRILISSLFPLNLSSTTSRLVLRSPGIYFLWRSLAHLIVIVLQAGDLFPSSPWLESVAKWGAEPEMTEICWNTFLAVCLALSIDALMRGLEGSNSSSSPFNLFGYAFLLHIYSSPITHERKQGRNVPTRPDKHVLITIVIPLLQLTLLHTLSARKKWMNLRLIPTSICGLLTLLHFHFVLFFSPMPYPLINYLPSVLETVLISIILLTVTLHALTQLFLEGRITRPVLGHARTLTPRWDEDFSVAILRVGTACLEATSAAGMGNEVVGVGAALTQQDEPQVELGRAQLVGIRGMPGRKSGFDNEIKHVKAVKANDSDSWIDMVWLREWSRFLHSVWGVLQGAGRLLRRATWKRLRSRWGKDAETTMQSTREAPRKPYRERELDNDVYQRFLHGEVVSDDDTEFVDESEDEEFRDRSPSDSEEDVGSEVREAAALYEDLSAAAAPHRAGSTTPPPFTPMLLAHVTSPSPLTRRQYNRFLARPEDGWKTFIDERRAGHSQDNAGTEDETRRNCVVCTVSAREVICWPCRCLALCDDCRANLASRFPASKHTCPCCRRSVEGYSRIYIP